MGPVVVGIVGGLVVAGSIEAYHIMQEISKETDAWKACLKLCQYCAKARPDLVTVTGPKDNDYAAVVKKPRTVTKSQYGETEIEIAGALRFVDHWYKSNELFVIETQFTREYSIYSWGKEILSSNYVSSEETKIDPKEFRSKLVADLNIVASRTASRRGVPA